MLNEMLIQILVTVFILDYVKRKIVNQLLYIYCLALRKMYKNK